MKHQKFTLVIKDITHQLQEKCRRSVCSLQIHSDAWLLVIGLCLLSSGLAGIASALGPTGSNSEAQFDPELIQCAVGHLFLLIEGAFGALIMVVSGIGAIIAAAMGAYRACLGMLVVAVGSFILRSLVSLFFGTDFPTCESN